jgi:hypothetical protein
VPRDNCLGTRESRDHRLVTAREMPRRLHSYRNLPLKLIYTDFDEHQRHLDVGCFLDDIMNGRSAPAGDLGEIARWAQWSRDSTIDRKRRRQGGVGPSPS